jgi:plasmid stability protein
VTTLMVRSVEPAVKERLRVRAAQNGHSMEAELRSILNTVLAPSPELNLAEAIRRRVAAFGSVDLDPPPALPLAPAFLFEP